MKARKIQSDLLLATSSHLLQTVFGYVVIVMLARNLDKVSMGEFFFATALSTMIALLTELGTSTYLNRCAAEDPGSALPRLSEIVTLRLLLILLSLLMISGVTAGLRPELALTVILVSLAVFLQNLYYSFGAFFVGLRRVGYRFITGLTGPVLLVALITTAVSVEATLTNIAVCYVVANATMVVVTFVVVRWKFGPLPLAWEPRRSLTILRASMPFFVLAFFALVHSKIDTVMLFFLGSADAVASYEAGYKILEVSRFVIRPVAMVFFPLCAALVVRGESGKLRILVKKLIVAAGAAGVAVSLGVVSGADWIVPAIFGNAYTDSVPIVRILFLVAPALYVGFVSTFLATSLHLERTAVKLTVGLLLINIVLNGVSIPKWGVIGAAWSTVITEWALAISLLFIVVQQLRSGKGSIHVVQGTGPGMSQSRLVVSADRTQEAVDCDA